MLDLDLQRRVDRLFRGEGRPDDLDRILLGLRGRSYGRDIVRELGDFVAHRDQREKGVVTAQVRDIFTSFESWIRCQFGQLPTLEKATKVAQANLRIATDEQLASRLQLRRNVAKSVLVQAGNKIEKGQNLTDRETLVFNYLAGAFIWNAVFTDQSVAEDLFYVLKKADLVKSNDRSAFDQLKPFITLYIIAVMHGSAVTLDSGSRVDLVAGFDNKEGRLEVKALLILDDQPKPVFAPICVFWTELLGTDHCNATLLGEPNGWSNPIEIDAQGKLSVMT